MTTLDDFSEAQPTEYRFLPKSWILDKVRPSYGPVEYFSNIFISGKNVAFFVQKMQADHNLNRL